MLMKLRRIRLTTLAALSVLLIAGCASTGAGGRSTSASGVIKKPDLPKLTASATLDDLLTYAALNNDNLHAAYLKWEAEVLKQGPAGALPDPQLRYAYFIEEVQTRVGTQEHRIGISQMFPWFGKLKLRKAIQSDAAAAAMATFESKKLDLQKTIKQLYYDYHLLNRTVALTDQNRKLLVALEPVVRAKVRTGKGAAGLVRLQTAIGQIEDRLQNLRSRYAPLQAQLNAALGRDAENALPLKVNAGDKPATAERDELLKRMRSDNPDIHRASLLVTQAERGVQLAKKNYFPNIGIGVDYIVVDRNETNISDNGKDAITAGISLSLPLNFRKYRRLREAAEKKLLARKREQSGLVKRLSAELLSTLAKLDDAERTEKIYRDTLIPKAKQALKITQQAYQNNQVGFTDFIDVQRQLLEFELQHERAGAATLQRLAEVEQLVGGKMPQAKSKGDSQP